MQPMPWEHDHPLIQTHQVPRVLCGLDISISPEPWRVLKSCAHQLDAVFPHVFNRPLQSLKTAAIIPSAQILLHHRVE